MRAAPTDGLRRLGDAGVVTERRLGLGHGGMGGKGKPESCKAVVGAGKEIRKLCGMALDPRKEFRELCEMTSNSGKEKAEL